MWGPSVSREARGPGGEKAQGRRCLEACAEVWMGSAAGQDLGEEDEQVWGTHCQAFMARRLGG